MIKRLREIAMHTGFLETGIIEVGALQYHAAVREICEENSCGNYGQSWACPPAVGTLEQSRERCGQYQRMMLFSGRYTIEDSFDCEGMTDSMIQFKKQVEQFDEQIKSYLDDYMLLSNEGCGRCKKCTWPDAPCRFENKLYHSIEGYGLMVSQLAEQAGINYNNGENTIAYFGALLF